MTPREIYDEVVTGGALQGDMVIQRLHPKPDQCFLKFDHGLSYADQELTVCNPRPSTLDPRPSTLDPRPSFLDPRPSTLDPRPSTLDPELPLPSTLDPRPSTLDPQLPLQPSIIGSWFGAHRPCCRFGLRSSILSSTRWRLRLQGLCRMRQVGTKRYFRRSSAQPGAISCARSVSTLPPPTHRSRPTRRLSRGAWMEGRCISAAMIYGGLMPGTKPSSGLRISTARMLFATSCFGRKQSDGPTLV